MSHATLGHVSSGCRRPPRVLYVFYESRRERGRRSSSSQSAERFVVLLVGVSSLLVFSIPLLRMLCNSHGEIMSRVQEQLIMEVIQIPEFFSLFCVDV